MTKYTLDQVSELTKKVNTLRNKLFDSMNWPRTYRLTEGDMWLVLEALEEMKKGE